ncbi:MAG: S-methyl-5-thioribose-1-phosphate isomerase [Opitutaceae bacterium]
MNVDGKPYRTIWREEETGRIWIIDQAALPHAFLLRPLDSAVDAARAISEMQVRGAPLIGATAAYGFALALQEAADDQAMEAARSLLLNTRPTAVNLRWALDRMKAAVADLPIQKRAAAALGEATRLCDEDVRMNESIGLHGLTVLRALADQADGRPLQILTHCNAGWLATVDWGTALAPVYKAHAAGIPIHVWVGETRPRNQGAALTAWELESHGIPHTLIVDNAGGHLMQTGKVDLCLVGTDRTTASGDVCNKIGTYLKALAAHDNGVPFYVALPSPTVDWTLGDGRRIPIEERSPREVTHLRGLDPAGRETEIRIAPEGSPAANYAFDLTPARLITGLITERGLVAASRAALAAMYPEFKYRGSRPDDD